MTLSAPLSHGELFLATGDDVNPHRPVLIGDIWEDIQIAGYGAHTSMVIAHPCSIRGKHGALNDKIMCAVVRPHPALSDKKWESGFFGLMPLKECPPDGTFRVVDFAQMGVVLSRNLDATKRLACLHATGINQLLERYTHYMSRVEISVQQFQRSFNNTYAEAEMEEEWATALSGSESDAARSFNDWFNGGHPPRRQRLLNDDAQRGPLWQEMQSEITARLQAGMDEGSAQA